jgi:hypothetical protein
VQPGQQPEVCNGVDDDCDGTNDNGKLCSDGNSCEGASGCRCNGSAPCSAPQHCCSSGCVDIQQDADNCGGCGVACGVNEACDGGRCRCGTTLGAPGGGPACTSGTCTGGTCTTCNSTVNIAPQAVASSSGGGTGNRGPAAMNNNLLEASCDFHWVNAGDTPSGKWIQLSWSAPVTVGRVWFDTAAVGGDSCGNNNGRTLAGGTLQYWSGTQWLGVSSVWNRTNDWSLTITPVTTTKIRLYDIVAPSTGQKLNPIIFEWRAYCQ